MTINKRNLVNLLIRVAHTCDACPAYHTCDVHTKSGEPVSEDLCVISISEWLGVDVTLEDLDKFTGRHLECW